MTVVNGISSIALSALINDNKTNFILLPASYDKVKLIFKNLLRKKIKNFKAENLKQLLNLFRNNKKLLDKITAIDQKGTFFSTNDLLPDFQKVFSDDVTDSKIVEIFTTFNSIILNDKELKEDLEKLYIQVLIKHKNWQLAQDYYVQCLDIYEDAEDNYNMARTHTSIGDIYQATGEWNKAIGNYSKALESYEHVGDINGVANCYGSLGIAHQANDQKDKAIESYNKSLEYFEQDNDDHGKALTLNNLGLIYQDIGEPRMAKKLYSQSWDIFEKDGDLQGMAQTMGNLSMVAFAEKDHHKAIKQFFEILFLYMKMESQEQVSQASSIIRYFTNQMESAKVGEIFSKVQNELSDNGISWGRHTILSSDDVKQIYVNLNHMKSNQA